MYIVYWENFVRFIIVLFIFILSWRFKMGLMKFLK